MTMPKLEPLKLSCSNSDCGNDLHCFRKSKQESRFSPGECQSCGASLVDWSRVHRKEIGDAANTIAELKKEWIRHEYWHREIDQRALNYARRKGRTALYAGVRDRLQKHIGVKTSLDGRQTPWEGNPICYAQHATACCCRRCMDYWHGIPVDHTLSDEEVSYFVELCTRYLDERFPDLPDYGQHVPPIRKRLSLKKRT